MRVSPSLDQKIGHIVRDHMPSLGSYADQYKDLHSHPELGKQESRTASIAAKHLERLGFQVRSGIGGHGVAGVLQNGPGRTVLLRADMDALPVLEETCLPYASHVRQQNSAGEEVPVMHACGHDMHVACLMAVSTLLRDCKSTWSGTLICVFQPNEEGGAGAQAMVDGGLYHLVPIPDIILGQHVDHRRAGNVAICPGPFMAAADSFIVTIYGRGGHGSQPQFCVDPIVISSYIIVRLQSIVSHIVAPLDAAVVTCASIHGGSAENVIPEQVELKLNVRTYDPDVRKRILDAVHAIIRSECQSAGATKDPDIKPYSSLPVTDNDAKLSKTLSTTFTEFFGGNRTETLEKLAGSEDVSNLAKPNLTPYAFWCFGGTDAKEWDEAKKEDRLGLIPRNHSSKFAPVIEPTMATGVQALALGALRFLIRSDNAI